jgi:hypothetical protein
MRHHCTYKALELRGWRGCGNQLCLQLVLLRKGREGKGREGKGREGKGREGKGREGKGREGKGREGNVEILKTATYALLKECRWFYELHGRVEHRHFLQPFPTQSSHFSPERRVSLSVPVSERVSMLHKVSEHCLCMACKVVSWYTAGLYHFQISKLANDVLIINDNTITFIQLKLTHP